MRWLCYTSTPKRKRFAQKDVTGRVTATRRGKRRDSSSKSKRAVDEKLKLGNVEATGDKCVTKS